MRIKFSNKVFTRIRKIRGPGGGDSVTMYSDDDATRLQKKKKSAIKWGKDRMTHQSRFLHIGERPFILNITYTWWYSGCLLYMGRV